MIKYNIVKCCYDTIVVNVAAYVIPGYITYAATSTKILSQQHVTILYFIILIIQNFS